MNKNEVMKALLFPEYVKNSSLIEEINNFDKKYNNAKLDLMMYVVYLEEKGLTYEEMEEKITNYSKSKHFNNLDEVTKKSLIKSTLKTLKRNV